MTNELNEKETQKLFNDMSSAIRQQEFDKIDELATSPTEEDKPTDVPAVVTPDDTDGSEPDNTGNDSPADENKPDDDDTGKKEDDKPVEKTDQEKLAEALALIEKVKEENHALRSQAGRVPHLQRQVQQIDKKLEQLNKLATSPSSRPSTKITEKISPTLAKIKDADPELAEYLASLLADSADTVAEDLRNAEIQSLQNDREAALEEYRKQEYLRLLDMYPNAPEVFKSPSWKDWEEKQTSRIQALANSDNADDVSFAFKKYAEDMVKLHPELAKKPEEKAVVPNEEAARIEAERKRKASTSVVVGSPTQPARQTQPDNDEALFKQYSEQIRKEIAGK